MFNLKKNKRVILMALNIDAKICAFKNDMRSLGNFCRLKDTDFILEGKIMELNQIKICKN